MRILSPLLTYDEVEPLCAAGADDLYCGLVDASGALNDRPNTAAHSFLSASELERSVRAAHARGSRVFLTINSMLPSLAAALEQASLAREIKLDGIIVANLFLMKRLSRMRLGLELQASSLMTVLNSASAMLLKDMGVTHIHLPTQLAAREVGAMVARVRGVSFGVFVAGGMCRQVEGFCALHWGYGEDPIPCFHFHAAAVTGSGTLSVTQCDKRLAVATGRCMLCALRQFKAAGVSSFKLEGRGAPLAAKISHVRMVRKTIQAAESSMADGAYVARCRKIFVEARGVDCHEGLCGF